MPVKRIDKRWDEIIKEEPVELTDEEIANSIKTIITNYVEGIAKDIVKFDVDVMMDVDNNFIITIHVWDNPDEVPLIATAIERDLRLYLEYSGIRTNPDDIVIKGIKSSEYIYVRLGYFSGKLLASTSTNISDLLAEYRRYVKRREEFEKRFGGM